MANIASPHGPNTSPGFNPAVERKIKMRHVWVVVFCLAVSGFALGQDSRADLFGGYSYVNIDTNNLSPRQNANGWEAAVSGNFNKWFAVEGDVSGYYKTYTAILNGTTATAKITDYSFAGGPRINFKPVFIHALFGGDHLTGTASESGVSGNVPASQDGLAGLVGGGVQFRVSGPWSIRASADYVFTRHNIFGGPSVTQNNYRAGVGIVYSFGGRHASEPVRVPQPSAPPVSTPTPAPAPPPQASAPPQPSTPHLTGGGMKIESLGVKVTLGRSAGAEIIDEAPNGGSSPCRITTGRRNKRSRRQARGDSDGAGDGTGQPSSG
jgi:Outer membrane protein beta-barrel domain